MKKFKCLKNKVRLDKFLVKKLSKTSTKERKGFSRSKIQHLIEVGQVKVNSETVNKKHYWLDEGDEIEITPSPPTPLPQRRRGEFNFKKGIKVIKKTKDYVIIEKPANLIVHPAENVKEYTLVDWLKKKYPQIKEVGDEQDFRPGIVHRLDRQVSGLMIVALTLEMFKHLKFQFQNRSVIKKYLALVHGEMEDQVGQIDFPIERSKRSGKMVAKPHKMYNTILRGKPKHLDKKEALTLWETKEKFAHHTLLDVQIKTGRTHQIRAHMQAIDHSIVGDNLYKNKEYKDKFNLNRIFLHAYYLEFKDLKGEKQKFEIELPKEVEKIIKVLRN